jgi:hypothetical protein
MNNKLINDLPTQTKPKTLAIMATCGSQYPFLMPNLCPPDIQVTHINSRATIRTLMSPLAIPVEDTDDIPCFPYQRDKERFLYFDLKKKVLDDFATNPADYFLLELGDELRETALWRGSLVAYSDYFEMFIPKVLRQDIEIFRVDDPRSIQETLQMIPAFMDRVIQIFGRNRIIVHEGYPAEYYLNENGQLKQFPVMKKEKNRLIIPTMKLYYDAIREQYPDIPFIFVDPKYRISPWDHPWKSDPGHFLPEYYESMLAQFQTWRLNKI